MPATVPVAAMVVPLIFPVACIVVACIVVGLKFGAVRIPFTVIFLNVELPVHLMFPVELKFLVLMPELATIELVVKVPADKFIFPPTFTL